MNISRKASCFVFLSLAITGCRASDSAPPAPSASAASAAAIPSAAPSAEVTPPPKALRGRPKNDREMPTTSAEIALGNMDSQLAELERLTKLDPKNVARLRMLSNMHVTRGKHRGDLDEIQLGIDMIAKCILLSPNEGDLYLDRANEEQSLHRFKEARADLQKAKALGAKADAIADVEQELDWNDGKYEPAMAAIRAARARHPTMMTVARVAQLAHDLGKHEEADREFEAAEDLITDTNPIPVAWLDVQRGLHKVKTGRLDEAIVFYREAVARIPSFVMAREHLAEALHMLGKDEEATAIYESIVKTSTDPEFTGQLAGLYREQGKTKEADALRAKATARYGELLRKFPEAMYWHASEYFSEEGADPKRTLELLQKNIALRPNMTSFVALASAQLAVGDAVAAKASIDTALAMPIVSAELFWTAARVYAKSDAPKSEAFAARAKAFNPRIDREEPAITR